MVLRIMRRFDSYSPIEDCGSPLVGLTTNKAIEFIENGMGRPPIEGPGHRNFPGWRFVIFAKGCGAITVLAEHFSQWRYAIGTNTRIAGKGSGQFHNGSGIVHMMVTTRQQRRACGRAKGSRVKTVVAQTSCSKLIK